MKFNVLLAGVAVFFCSCGDHTSRLDGFWQADFADSINNPVQYLEIKHSRNGLTINIDEPDEDWFDIPGEQAYFKNDSLHFKKFWGMETYDGVLLPGDSVLRGVKLIKNQKAVPFVIRKKYNPNYTFRVPKTGPGGEQVLKYHYLKPAGRTDHFLCGTIEEAGIDTVRIYELVDRILNGQIPNIHSLLIMKNNKLVLEEYFYGYTADRPHRIHSVTKSITSALVGIAIDKYPELTVEEPVWKYFAERSDCKWVAEKYDITLEHLLTMSAGLDWKGLTLNESNDDMDMYKTDDYFGYLLNKNQQFQPGSEFCYNNGLSLMLGHIIEKASGIRADSFARVYLFDHMKADKYSWDIDKNGIARMDGGLKMRPRDMLLFGSLYLNNGQWEGEQILSENWVTNSTSQKIDLNDRGYAYHWWTMDYTINGSAFSTFYALGHGEQAIIVVPGSQLVFVMTAGNYMQVEHRPFEIMSQYILPSL